MHTLSISNLSSSILNRAGLWRRPRINHVILGAGFPDVEKLNDRLPPSLMTMKEGGFFVKRGGAVGCT